MILNNGIIVYLVGLPILQSILGLSFLHPLKEFLDLLMLPTTFFTYFKTGSFFD